MWKLARIASVKDYAVKYLFVGMLLTYQQSR